MNRKDAAVSFLRMASSGDVDAAYAAYIAPGFIHHNPYFRGDRESLRLAMKEAHGHSPNRAIDIRKVFEDGDHVITLSRVMRENAADPDVAVVHIFRFEGDQVAELWDLGQLVDPDSPNENGPF